MACTKFVYALFSILLARGNSTCTKFGTANFTLRKFQTVNNWYQFLTVRDKLVPTRHIFQYSSHG